MRQPLPGGADETDSSPRRLHPATMLTSVVRGSPSLLLGAPAVLALRGDAGLALWVVGLLLVVGGGLQALAWLRFTYRLGGDALVIERGLLSRHRRTIPYERVADVGIERRPLQRLFGLATVTFETGGAGSDEGRLDSVGLAEAERLRDAVRRLRGGAAADPVPVGRHGDPATEAAPLYALAVPDLIVAGLLNFSLVWIAVAFGAVDYVRRLLDLDSAFWDMLVARTEAARTLPWLVWLQAILAAVGAALVLGSLAGLAQTFLRDFGFRLTRVGANLRRTRGLFTRSEAVIAIPRVQLAMLASNPVSRRLGRARLSAQVLGGAGEAGLQDLAPFATADDVARLLPLLGLELTAPDRLQPVGRGHVWRMLARRALPPALLIAGLGLFDPRALAAAPLLLPLAITAALARRHHRYGLADGLLQVQRGVARRRSWVMPVARIQAIMLSQSWLQRRLGLASVTIDAAGGPAPRIEDLRAEEARALLAALMPSRGNGPAPAGSG